MATRDAQIRYAVYGVIAAAGVMGFGAYEYVRTEGWSSLLPIAVLLCAVIAIAWFALAMFLDAAHNRRRCPKCWYDMSATDGLRCPECGRTAKSEKRVRRTRRHWRLALLAILPALLSVYIALLPRIREHGWQSVLPTTALIWCLELEDNEWAFVELGRRAFDQDPTMGFLHPREGALYAWQWRQVGGTCIELIESDLLPGQRYGLLDWITRTKWALHGDQFVKEINAALVRLLDDADPRIRQTCAIFISDIGDPDASIEHLRQLLRDEDPKVRRGATTGFRILVEESDEAVRAVAEALEDRDGTVRTGALGALGRAGQYRVIPPDLIERIRALADDPDPTVREYQVVTLVRILDDETALAAFESALRSDDVVRRYGAYSVLAYEERFDVRAYLPELIRGLSDQHDDARLSVAVALRHLDLAALLPFEEEVTSAIDEENYPNSSPHVRELLVGILQVRSAERLEGDAHELPEAETIDDTTSPEGAAVSE